MVYVYVYVAGVWVQYGHLGLYLVVKIPDQFSTLGT